MPEYYFIRKRSGKTKAFTLIELVMVIVILGILAVVAVPKFFNLTNDAKEASEKGIVGAVRSGIYTYFASNKGVWPVSLDSATSNPCSSTNACFTTVLAQGGVTSDWVKTGANIYRGPAGITYTYTPASGDFK
jgi:prepilin-type N-terminal cleavage/methylation domain-containing protein